MSYIAQLTLLQEVDLENCYNITDKGIRELASLPALREGRERERRGVDLNIDDCELVTEEGLQCLSSSVSISKFMNY